MCRANANKKVIQSSEILLKKMLTRQKFAICLVVYRVNSVCPIEVASDAMRRHRPESTLVKIMACCR